MSVSIAADHAQMLEGWCYQSSRITPLMHIAGQRSVPQREDLITTQPIELDSLYEHYEKSTDPVIASHIFPNSVLSMQPPVSGGLASSFSKSYTDMPWRTWLLLLYQPLPDCWNSILLAERSSKKHGTIKDTFTSYIFDRLYTLWHSFDTSNYCRTDGPEKLTGRA